MHNYPFEFFKLFGNVHNSLVSWWTYGAIILAISGCTDLNGIDLPLELPQPYIATIEQATKLEYLGLHDSFPRDLMLTAPDTILVRKQKSGLVCYQLMQCGLAGDSIRHLETIWSTSHLEWPVDSTKSSLQWSTSDPNQVLTEQFDRIKAAMESHYGRSDKMVANSTLQNGPEAQAIIWARGTFVGLLAIEANATGQHLIKLNLITQNK